MIKDSIRNANKYYNLSPKFQKAFEYVETHDLKAMPCGRYIIDGDDIYVNIDEYETKTSDKVESHKTYIDIQIILSGEENIGIADIQDLTPITDYNEVNDIIFYNGNSTLHHIKENEFMILYPQDGHLPCQMINQPLKVKKAVVKIKI